MLVLVLLLVVVVLLLLLLLRLLLSLFHHHHLNPLHINHSYSHPQCDRVGRGGAITAIMAVTSIAHRPTQRSSGQWQQPLRSLSL